jgi:tetratricopeptide (TPR) repeat protein
MYSRSCEDSSSPLANASELIGRAKQFALAKFRKHVAPYYITFEIKLMDSTEGITSKEAEKKFEQGTDFAKHNRFDRACELWGEARILSPNSVSILYNLGICSEVTGELEQALDLYNKADKLLNKPDENITQALRRISASVKERKKLQEQMKDEKIETKNEQVEKDKNIEPESTDKPTEKKRRRVK